MLSELCVLVVDDPGRWSGRRRGVERPRETWFCLGARLRRPLLRPRDRTLVRQSYVLSLIAMRAYRWRQNGRFGYDLELVL